MGDDGTKSAFNEGALQMVRIDELQQRLNMLNVDPLGFNTFTNQYNYETIFKTLNSLLAETSSKLSSDELKEAMRIREIILNFFKFKPIFEEVHIDTLGIKKTFKRVNESNWAEMQEILFFYEMRIRHYLEEHDLTSPKVEAEGGWD